MKLAYQQLAQHVNKTLAPIYLVSGDELLLVQEAVDLIRASAQQAGFSERTRVRVETGSEWGNYLYKDTHSLSLFALKRIVELDLRGLKFTQANSDILIEYAEEPNPNTLLLLYTDKLDKKTEQARWYKAVEKNGVTVTIWPVPAEQLPQWIMQRAKKMNLTLSVSAATWLAQQVEGNLLAAAQEIEKLYLLQPKGVIDVSLLAENVMNHARFDIFNLVDSILAGNTQRVLNILTSLFAEEIEPTLILWAITRELRTMALLSRQVEQGVALASLFNQFRIWEKRQSPVRAFLKRATAKSFQEWLIEAGKIDRIIKGVEPGNSQNELERLAISMASNVIL